MKDITVTCDRCGKVVEGTIGVCPSTGAIITGGYYNVGDESSWHEFARWEEEIVCDDCMHSCSNYKKIYGVGLEQE